MYYTLGVDIGSASSKAVILNGDREVIASAVIQAGTGTSGPGRVMAEIFSTSGLRRGDIDWVVATGYGRYQNELANSQVSEITCHAKGVHYLFPSARTILDIGGQDAKAISINENGRVLRFFMNEKCAAGTGRFLEVMSRILEIPLSDMGQYDELAQDEVQVSSTCTVFAESEVISLLSRGEQRNDIVRGVHNSVVSRAAGLLYRTAMEPDFVLTGGVAQNAGVVRALERELKRSVLVSDQAQLTGAIGAALLALEQVMKQEGNQ